MIRFEGYRSKETMRYVTNVGLKVFIPLGFLVLIPCIFIIIFCNDTVIKIILCVPFVLCSPLVASYPILAVKTEKKLSYLKFEVDYEYYGGTYGIGEIENIKAVMDYGDFYKIVRSLKANCIIQKDLIVEGTIEEFEELFHDKIVRKQNWRGKN